GWRIPEGTKGGSSEKQLALCVVDVAPVGEEKLQWRVLLPRLAARGAGLSRWSAKGASPHCPSCSRHRSTEKLSSVHNIASTILRVLFKCNFSAPVQNFGHVDFTGWACWAMAHKVNASRPVK